MRWWRNFPCGDDGGSFKTGGGGRGPRRQIGWNNAERTSLCVRHYFLCARLFELELKRDCIWSGHKGVRVYHFLVFRFSFLFFGSIDEGTRVRILHVTSEQREIAPSFSRQCWNDYYRYTCGRESCDPGRLATGRSLKDFLVRWVSYRMKSDTSPESVYLCWSWILSQKIEKNISKQINCKKYAILLKIFLKFEFFSSHNFFLISETRFVLNRTNKIWIKNWVRESVTFHCIAHSPHKKMLQTTAGRRSPCVAALPSTYMYTHDDAVVMKTKRYTHLSHFCHSEQSFGWKSENGECAIRERLQIGSKSSQYYTCVGPVWNRSQSRNRPGQLTFNRFQSRPNKNEGFKIGFEARFCKRLRRPTIASSYWTCSAAMNRSATQTSRLRLSTSSQNWTCTKRWATISTRTTSSTWWGTARRRSQARLKNSGGPGPFFLRGLLRTAGGENFCVYNQIFTTIYLCILSFGGPLLAAGGPPTRGWSGALDL